MFTANMQEFIMESTFILLYTYMLVSDKVHFQLLGIKHAINY